MTSMNEAQAAVELAAGTAECGPSTELTVADQTREIYNAMLALPIEKLAETASALMDALDYAMAAQGEDRPSEEEITFLQAQAFAAQDALMTKPDNYVGFLKHLEMQELMLQAEIKRLQARKKTFENKQERLEGRLFEYVQRAPEQKIQTMRYTISLAKKPAKLAITNLEEVPGMFKTITPAHQEIIDHPAKTEVDEKAILALLKRKNATPVPGAELVQEYRLQIR